MRHRLLAFSICVIVAAIVVSGAFAQRQVQDPGWIDIGSKKETATLKRPLGSIYQGSGFITYVGKPPKPYLQHDMGAYELDPAPAAHRSRPYNRRDFAGVWEEFASSGGSISQRIPPMTPRGWEILNERITASGPRAHLSETKPVNNPDLTCEPLGWPVILRGNRPMEIFHVPGRVLQHQAWHENWRTIWMDGRLLPKTPDPTWMGYSVGKWVGNILVVDTVGIDSRVWLDGSGSVIGPNAEIQERWLRTDHNTLQLSLTLKDPDIYIEGTWESSSPRLFQLYPYLEVDHTPCVPSEEMRYRENSPTEIPTAGQK